MLGTLHTPNASTNLRLVKPDGQDAIVIKRFLIGLVIAFELTSSWNSSPHVEYIH